MSLQSLLNARVSILVVCLYVISPSLGAEEVRWPNGGQMAISLMYDDSLNSQLDNAVPVLRQHGITASFYLTLTAPTVMTRIDEWRALAKQGYELGNHTVFHSCSASLPNRDWVDPNNNLDNYNIAKITQELKLANSFLHALDGQKERTFSPPCGDRHVAKGQFYWPEIADMFVAVKGLEGSDKSFVNIWEPSDVSAKALIDRVELEAAKGTQLFTLVIHGVGGDYLSLSSEAHAALVAYLAKNRDRFYVDSYINIMRRHNSMSE